jgi:hypothetical protein
MKAMTVITSEVNPVVLTLEVPTVGMVEMVEMAAMVVMGEIDYSYNDL